MESNIVQKLIEVNRQFYQTFAQPFCLTRQRLQSGTKLILGGIPSNASILDLGCGNGEVCQFLLNHHFEGNYRGLDFSSPLLEYVKSRYSNDHFSFSLADFTTSDWDSNLDSQLFAVIFSFAVFHHLPGEELRLTILRKILNLLSPNGKFYISVWQFHNSPRLRQRVQSWEEVGLNNNQVDQGDYLLDWRSGGRGYRYIHLFNEAELEDLAQNSGFRIVNSYFSDGYGGKLGLYQEWDRV